VLYTDIAGAGVAIREVNGSTSLWSTRCNQTILSP